MKLAILFFVFLAVICWGTGAFFDKLILRRLEPFHTFLAKVIVTIILFLPLIVWKMSPFRKAIETAGKMTVLFVFLSVAVTMGGVYFYLKAMSGAEASRIVPLSSTYPLITFLLAFFFLGESFTLSKFIGIILVAGGVFFLSK